MMPPSALEKANIGESASNEHEEQAFSNVAEKSSALSADGEGNSVSVDVSHPQPTSLEPLKDSVASLDTGREPLHKPLANLVTSSLDLSTKTMTSEGAHGITEDSDPCNITKDRKHTPETDSFSAAAIASKSNAQDSMTRDKTKPDGPPRSIQPPISGASGENCVVDAVATADVASRAGATENVAVSAAHAEIQPGQYSERSTKSKGGSLRRGKWTVEEEAYVARVIQDFNSGILNAPAGTTLRSYLSDKLQCDPMRITKKFTGGSCIGKRVFHPAVRSAANSASIDKAQAELDVLEKRWRRRLEMQQRESAKKAAASVAAANAANRETSAMVQGVPVSMLGSGIDGVNGSEVQQTAVTQAASWLDRANAILKGTVTSEGTMYRQSSNQTSTSSSPQPRDESTQSSGDDSLESQMKEVQRLIFEGPAIQQTAAAFPNLLIQTSHSSDLVPGDSSGATQSTPLTGSLTPGLEPADKRMRTSSDTSPTDSGAADAEALIGFLSSVRASAAAGHDLA